MAEGGKSRNLRSSRAVVQSFAESDVEDNNSDSDDEEFVPLDNWRATCFFQR